MEKKAPLSEEMLAAESINAEAEKKAKEEAAAKAKAEAEKKAKEEAAAKAKAEAEVKTGGEAKKRAEAAKLVFENYPAAKEVYFTSDNTAFLEANHAANHARTQKYNSIYKIQK